MLSGRARTASAIPSGSGGDDAWGLFGAGIFRSEARCAPNAPPPRVVASLLRVRALRVVVRRALRPRRDDARAPGRGQDLARRCERRGRMERLRDALETCGSSDAGASEVIAAAVDALQSTDDDDASLLNECILTARGIKCLEAMARSPLEGIEAAVLLSEHATHTAAPDDDARRRIGRPAARVGRRDVRRRL